MVHHSAVLRFLREQNCLQLSQQAQGQEQAPGPGNTGTQSSARPITNSIPVNRCATTLATDPLQTNNSLLEALLSRDMAQRQGEHLTHDQSLLLGILQQQESAKKHQESLPIGLAPAPPSLSGMQKQLEEPASLGPHDQDVRPSQQGRENTEDGESVRVPCRARGMPADHNFQTAHFTISKNLKHAEELICSYPACRDGGVKFCYCAHCQIPVAKRNFRIRHHHYEAAPVPTAGSDEFEASQAAKRVVSSQPTHAMRGHSSLAQHPRSDEGDRLLMQLAQLQRELPTPSDARAGLTSQAEDTRHSFEDQQVTGQHSGASRRTAGFFVGQNSSFPTNSHLTDGSGTSADEAIVRVPCRARGMPPDHKFDTAQFVIRKEVKHGDELVCSYPACRDAGVKFCFCTHCCIPVAKRNFRIRHNHCDFVPPAATARQAASGPQCHPVVTSSLSDYLNRIPRNLEPSKNTERNATRGHTTTGHDNPDTTLSTAMVASKEQPSSETVDAVSEPTEDRWAAWRRLFDRRPSKYDTDKMSTWLMNVFEVSNLDVPMVSQAKSRQSVTVSSSASSALGGPSNKLPLYDHEDKPSESKRARRSY